MDDQKTLKAIKENALFREGGAQPVRFRHIAEALNINTKNDKQSCQLDRALQRLKRNNAITYTHKDGWTVL